MAIGERRRLVTRRAMADLRAGKASCFASRGTAGNRCRCPPVAHQPNTARVSHDGRSIYYSVVSGPPEHHDLWRLSLADGAISRLTRLEGQRGRLGYYFAADARYLYFIWCEDDGDIWVMDAVTTASR